MAKRGKDDKGAAQGGGATRRVTRRAAPGERAAPAARSRTSAKAKPPPPTARSAAARNWIIAAGAAAATLAIVIFAVVVGQRVPVDTGPPPAATQPIAGDAPSAVGKTETGALESRLAALEAMAARPGGKDAGVGAGDTAAADRPAPAAAPRAVGKTETDALESRLAALEAMAARPGGDDAGVGAGDIAAADRPAPAAAPSAVGKTETGALESRLAALEAAAARPGGDDAGVGAGDIAAMIAPLGDRLAALEQAPDDVAARIAALEERVAAAPPGEGGDAAAALAGRIDALARTAEDVRTAVGALDSGLADLAARLSALEARIAASAGTRPAMLLAVGQLRGALRGSGPFVRELDAVRSVAAADAEIAGALDALAQRAAGGVPTLDVLRARFAEVAAKAVRADYARPGGSWGARAAGWLAALVTVRRVGDVAGDSTDAIVARAEARLAAGDLAAAIAQVESLAGPPAEAAAAWLADARARLDVEHALATLDARAVAALGAPGVGG